MPDYYIRFGRWSRRSTNYATGIDELGVSVYRARADSQGIVSLAEPPAEQLNGQGRLVFVVTGRVVGEGSAGEPLLRGVKECRNAIEFSSIPEGCKR